jgi:hypothetical protein
MPRLVDEATGEVLEEWDLTEEEIDAFIREFEERYPGLLEKLRTL